MLAIIIKSDLERGRKQFAGAGIEQRHARRRVANRQTLLGSRIRGSNLPATGTQTEAACLQMIDVG